MGTCSNSSLCILAGMAMASAAVSDASADVLSSTYEGPLREVRHSVEVERGARDLTLRVRREIRNFGDRVDEALLTVDLPAGAATVALRNKQGNQWIPGRLFATDEASSVYDQLTRTGPLASLGPAIMEWSGLGTQEIRMFPISARKTALVEYELQLPTCYRNGQRIAFYPKGLESDEELADGELARPVVRLGKGVSGRIYSNTKSLPSSIRLLAEECLEDEIFENAGDVEANHLIVLDSDSGTTVRSLFGLFKLGSGRTIGEVFIEIAAKLSALPKRAEVVFVLDMSFSQDTEDIRTQLELAEGYLAHIPDARYQIVLATRDATPLFREFKPAADARRVFAGLRAQLPARGNGSNLDIAARFASTLFSSDANSPKRIVAFTDSRLRETLTAPALSAALGSSSDAILHVLDVSNSSSLDAFERDDEHPLAAPVMATGGMLGLIGGGASVAETKEVMLPLVRPTQIDHVRIDDENPWRDVAGLPDTVKEGFGLRRMDVFEDSPGPLRFTGKIWGREVVWTSDHDPGASQNLPALVMGRGLSDELERREILAAAEAGKAISPETSYLAQKPGLAPSSYDYEDSVLIGTSHSIGVSHGFSTRCGGVGRIGHGQVVPVIKEGIDWGAAIAGQVAEGEALCAIKHPVADPRLDLVVETTGREIVDVLSPKSPSPYAQCVVEAVWSLRLGEPFERHEGRIDVSLAR